MSKSLQDQLLALGLAKKNARKKPAKSRQTPNDRRRPPSGRSADDTELSLDKAYALRKREEQKQADKARRKKQAEDRQRRLVNQEIRKIVDKHRLNNKQAEIARNFMFRGRIRKIYVTSEQQTALSEGSLGIVYLSGGYHLLATEPLEAVRAISADHLVDLDVPDDDEEFPVPDDLTW